MIIIIPPDFQTIVRQIFFLQMPTSIVTHHIISPSNLVIFRLRLRGSELSLSNRFVRLRLRCAAGHVLGEVTTTYV